MDLRAPKKAYFELLAHPAIITPYIDNDEIAKIYNIPTLILASTKFSDIGITLHAIKDNPKDIMGAKTKITLLALAGIIVSLENNFTPSAKGCNNPNMPTTFGPFRYCTAAMTFLSK